MLELKTSIVKLVPQTDILNLLEDLTDVEMDFEKQYNEIYYKMDSRDMYSLMDYIIGEYRRLESVKDVKYNIDYIGNGTERKVLIALAIEWKC